MGSMDGLIFLSAQIEHSMLFSMFIMVVAVAVRFPYVCTVAPPRSAVVVKPRRLSHVRFAPFPALMIIVQTSCIAKPNFPLHGNPWVFPGVVLRTTCMMAGKEVMMNAILIPFFDHSAEVGKAFIR